MSNLLAWTMSGACLAVVAPNAAAWGSQVLVEIDPGLPGWLVQGGPTAVVLGGVAWSIKLLLPRAVAFIDRGIAMLDRIEAKLDAEAQHDKDTDRAELRAMVETLRRQQDAPKD